MPPNQEPEPVIDFGPPRRRPTLIGLGRGLGRGLVEDRRVVPLAAVLGAVAAFLSMISEWQVTSVDGSAYGAGFVGDKLIPADLGDLGAFGAGYLAGLFLLVAALVLTMFGPVGGRRYARLTGLSVGGTMLALLLALTSLLGDQSRIVSRLYTLEIDGDQLRVTYGRGLWCALFGVVAALAALYLAGRHTPAAATSAAGEPVTEIWSWHRPRTSVEDLRPDEPFELTVSSANPFTTADDDHDEPRRPGHPGTSE